MRIIVLRSMKWYRVTIGYGNIASNGDWYQGSLRLQEQRLMRPNTRGTLHVTDPPSEGEGLFMGIARIILEHQHRMIHAKH